MRAAASVLEVGERNWAASVYMSMYVHIHT